MKTSPPRVINVRHKSKKKRKNLKLIQAGVSLQRCRKGRSKKNSVSLPGSFSIPSKRAGRGGAMDGEQGMGIGIARFP